MEHKRFYFAPAAACIGAVAGVGLRLWDLSAGSQGMSNTIFLVVSLLCMAVFLALSMLSPGRSGQHRVLSGGGFPVSLVAAVLILVGAGAEFAEALMAGPTPGDTLVCALGVAGSICCMIAARTRQKNQKAFPAAELLPVFYLLMKLMFNFRNWSIDPIISDYVVILFALICTLLSFHLGAGFYFDRGRTRRALFFTMAAVYFCAACIMDGVADLSLATVVTYCGFLLWHLPVVYCLSMPAGPDPKPEPEATQSDA